MFKSPTVYSSDVMGDAPWQGGCSEDDPSFEDLLLLPVIATYLLLLPVIATYRLHGPRCLARWVRFRPVGFGSGRRLGFVSGASGSKRNLGIGIKNEPKARTTMPMMTEGEQLHEGDDGFR